MNVGSSALQWSVLVLLAMATWLAYSQLWMIGPYYSTLTVLGAISAAVAMWIIRRSARRLGVLFLAGLVLLVGQWWLVEMVLVQLLWRLSGGPAP